MRLPGGRAGGVGGWVLGVGATRPMVVVVVVGGATAAPPAVLRAAAICVALRARSSQSRTTAAPTSLCPPLLSPFPAPSSQNNRRPHGAPGAPRFVHQDGQFLYRHGVRKGCRDHTHVPHAAGGGRLPQGRVAVALLFWMRQTPAVSCFCRRPLRSCVHTPSRFEPSTARTDAALLTLQTLLPTLPIPAPPQKNPPYTHIHPRQVWTCTSSATTARRSRATTSWRRWPTPTAPTCRCWAGGTSRRARRS